jgi:hypothetical protein
MHGVIKMFCLSVNSMFCLIILRVLQDNHMGPPFRIVTILLGIEDSAALKIALVISFVRNKVKKIRNEVISLVRNAKDKYNNDLIKTNYKHEFFLQKLVEHS